MRHRMHVRSTTLLILTFLRFARTFDENTWFQSDSIAEVFSVCRPHARDILKSLEELNYLERRKRPDSKTWEFRAKTTGDLGKLIIP